MNDILYSNMSDSLDNESDMSPLEKELQKKIEERKNRRQMEETEGKIPFDKLKADSIITEELIDKINQVKKNDSKLINISSQPGRYSLLLDPVTTKPYVTSAEKAADTDIMEFIDTFSDSGSSDSNYSLLPPKNLEMPIDFSTSPIVNNFSDVSSGDGFLLPPELYPKLVHQQYQQQYQYPQENQYPQQGYYNQEQSSEIVSPIVESAIVSNDKRINAMRKFMNSRLGEQFKKHRTAVVGTTGAVLIASCSGSLLLITIIAVIIAIYYAVKALRKKKNNN